MSTVVVLTAGLHTTAQDLGRWGHQAEGVPVAGAMDPFSHRRANALVGNSKDAATLEVTLTGPELRFEDSRLVAVAGAAFDILVDGSRVAAPEAFAVSAGSTVRLGTRRSGARGYIAIEGGVDVPQILGSHATHVPTGMGGWLGRALKKGDRLPLGRLDQARPHRRPVTQMAARVVSDPATALAEPLVVRILKGPQDDRFAVDALDELTAGPYVVGIDSNRMAYRLDGRPLRHRGRADIISDATPLGAIQVPASGQPVLLMADRQTTGGYAKIATVISADIGVAAQAAPGDRLQFRLCTAAEATTALIARERQLLALERGTA
jgi:antagonist of KipI